jgi:PKD repeat protein
MVTDSKICIASDIVTLTVNTSIPQSIFSFSDSGNGMLSFTDGSIDASTWAWNFGDGSTSTLQNPTHSFSMNDTYAVCLTVTNSCNPHTSCQQIPVIVTGILPNETPELMVYPNPITEEFTVRLDFHSTIDTDFVIHDALGKVVRSEKITGSLKPTTRSIKTAVWPSGAYLINVQVGDRIVTKRVIVNK